MDIMYKTYELNTDVEHFAKPINISGATTIRLTHLPSGVQCWISSESNGTNLYPLVNRGDGWVDLPEPLYNLYIYTKGTNVDNEKIILNYTGQRDFFQYGNSSTERIDKVGNLESISNNVVFDLFKSQKRLIDTSGILFLQYINGAWDETTVESSWNWASKIYLSKLCDFSMLTFNKSKWYRIILEGHADFGGENLQSDSTESNSNYYTRASDSLHLDLINEESLNLNTAFTKLNNQPYIDNIYKSNANNPVIERKTNFYCFWGYKRVNARGQFSGSHFLDNSYTPGNVNFISEYSAPGFIFENMKLLIMSLKAYRAWGGDTSGRALGRGFHFSLKVQIEELDMLPNSQDITSNPYINPRFLKQG